MKGGAAARIALLGGIVVCAGAQADDDLLARVAEALEKIGCEAPPGSVEVDDAGIMVHGAFCADGVFDIGLTPDFQVTAKRPR